MLNDFVDVMLDCPAVPVLPLNVIVYPVGGTGSAIAVVVPKSPYIFEVLVVFLHVPPFGSTVNV